ncbi:ketoglutarate-dependent dioxygenase alkB homolog 3 [Seminavis robusta]|uniref:Ketoglutarate-dependent dioxygenase alkB homolog 3 n=1 Tax=Seminavis robusta TaxID=568900 RepID=A0A9N8DLN9_9STRA|nr:ketoglutarate-dependent dioxygenase alkB homolog 3 [Seminavis robusta]|eukprot:Sro213_g088510.1 ketoglutarate-dependent dioxygenase alkB homolog 3 (459) ;mRNA; f:57700-59076
MKEDPWSCNSCTYRHESPTERQYLSCALCSARKNNNEPQRKKTSSHHKSSPSSSSSSHSSSSTRQYTPDTKRRKRQLLLSDAFQQPPKPNIQGTRKKSPTANTTTCILNGRSSVGEATTTRNKTDSTEINGDDNNTKEHPVKRRSILEALKPCSASSFVPPARYRDSPKEDWTTISLSQIPTLCPMTVIHNVLPLQVANSLLAQLEQESSCWNRGNWIIHGKEHQIPRTTATYQLLQDNDDTLLMDEEYLDNNPQRPVSPELRQAATAIAQRVQEQHSQPKWEPTFCLANRYATGQDCVGWHADHITPLGPRPIIVGLSLGACRRFELRHASATSGRHVSVPLPHNSIAIMWNDAQESWQHAVPRCSSNSLMQHATVGHVRISLTFRMQRHLPNLGKCHCGRPVGLKAKDGAYYCFCRPYGKDKHRTCGFWKRCGWAEQEAQRLIRLESCQSEEQLQK